MEPLWPDVRRGDPAQATVEEDELSALLDDVDFKVIRARMSRFNFFEAVGGARGELRGGTLRRWRRLHIFLTPTGANPENDAYVAFSYVQLAQVLVALADEDASESALIIRHYGFAQ